jgi:hypothetical protein
MPNKTPLLCSLLLKYSVSFSQLPFLHFVSHVFYLGCEQFHIKHTALVTAAKRFA